MISITIELNADDMAMVKTFVDWNKRHPTCSPKRWQAENLSRLTIINPSKTFDRLKMLGVIEHSRNGHCWLTKEGQRVAVLNAREVA